MLKSFCMRKGKKKEVEQYGVGDPDSIYSSVSVAESSRMKAHTLGRC